MVAAERLVAQRGFGGMSVNDVAIAAGFTKGAFYSNFESREAMILALLERLRTKQMATLDGLRALAATDLPQTLDAIAQFSAEHAADPVAVWLVTEAHALASRDPSLTDAIQAGFEKRITVLADLLDAIAAAAGLTPPMPGPDLARLLMAIVHGLAQQPADRASVPMITRTALRHIFGQ
ncbi:MAG TPA: TetR/AcrR family transcriptional regulator [Roseomonas sp.]|jgi:AcrR family transcriptional regulator